VSVQTGIPSLDTKSDLPSDDGNVAIITFQSRTHAKIPATMDVAP
jgi:hypothetical protein